MHILDSFFSISVVLIWLKKGSVKQTHSLLNRNKEEAVSWHLRFLGPFVLKFY